MKKREEEREDEEEDKGETQRMLHLQQHTGNNIKWNSIHIAPYCLSLSEKE